MRRVTLVYPGIVTCGFNSLGKGTMDSTWTNVGLAYIAAYLKKHGYKVDLIDLRACKDWSDVEDKIKKSKSKVIGIQFNTPNFNFASKCSELAKKYKKITVAGGPHASIDPESILKLGTVDYVIVGEGEISFFELVQKIYNNKPIRNRIIYGKRVENLDELPYPDFEIYKLNKILELNPDMPIIIMGSRGCYFQCAFCQPTIDKIFGKGVRHRSVENIIKEIKYIKKKYRTNYITFQDDTFTVNKKWVIDLCNKIINENLNIYWSAQSRVNTFDEEIAKHMSRAGCYMVFFGFESGSQRILNLMRKGITPDQSIRAANICRKNKMLIFADYILGNPTETIEDMRLTLELMKKIRPEIHSPTYFVPVPGTYLYEFCKENNLFSIKNYEDFARNPIGKKIKNIDYEIVERYKNKILKYSTKWYQEKHFFKIKLRKWLLLFKKRKFNLLFKDIILSIISKKMLKFYIKYMK
ncbi:MAG: radical SAM protein [Candidatus Aenigmatarchaeota archaeon]